MNMDAAELGKKGEEIARKFLKRKRYRILSRNYRCPAGEIDLIATDGEAVVFVEVKTRSSDELADPVEAVNYRKQQKLVRAARYYIHHKKAFDLAYRFDVIGIILRPGQKPDITHLEDAFSPAR